MFCLELKKRGRRFVVQSVVSWCPSQALCLPIMYTESNFVSLDEELRLDEVMSVRPGIILLVQVFCASEEPSATVKP